MTDKLQALADGLGKRRDFDAPPLHLWHPPLSGDIDIRIDREGRWFHEGDPILRESIVRLFAAILRREDDGQYYLVTPAEKWRIQVDAYPLLVTDFDVKPGSQGLDIVLNTGKRIELLDSQQWFSDPAEQGVAVARLAHGVCAMFSRAAWYRLIELSEAAEDGAVLLRLAGLELA